MRQGNRTIAQRVTQRHGEMLDAQRATIGRHVGGCPRLDARHRRSAHRPGQGDHGIVRIGRDEQVDRRQRLVIHAPAVMELMIRRNLDDLCLGRRPRRAQGAGQIDPIEAEDDVGASDDLCGFAGGHQQGRFASMERMVGRECRSDLDVGHDARIQMFGDADTRVPGVQSARRAPGEKDRLARGFQHARRLRDRLGWRAGRGRGRKTSRVWDDKRRLDPCLLHFGIEDDVSRTLWCRVRNPCGAND